MDKPESICTCKQCKKNFPAPSKRFSVCSPECQAILDAAYVRPPRPTITLTCQYCATTVTRKAQRYEFGKYCSRPCAYAGRAITRAAKAAEDKARKRVEQAARAVQRARDLVLAKAQRELDRDAAKALRDNTPKTYHCSICFGSYIKGEEDRRTPTCSTPCDTEYRDRRREKLRLCPNRKAHKVAEKARRRIKEQDSLVDKVDPIEIFKRDRWICYICGIDTPQHLRGSNKPNSPELEHVISLADGGPHSWRNLACACRACNANKGSTSFFDYVVNENGPQLTIKDIRELLG